MAAVSECGCGILVSVKAVTGCGGYGCNCVAFATAAVAAVNCPSSAVSTLSLGGGRVVLVVTVSAIGDAAINAEAGVCCSGCVCDGGVCDGGVCGGWGGRGCHGGPFSVSANCYVLFLRQLRCVAEIVGSLGGIGGVGDLVGLDFCDLSCSLYHLRIWQQLQIVALGCRWCRSLSWWTRCLSHSVGGAAEKDAVAAEAVEALCVGAGSSEIKRLSEIGSGGDRRLC